LLRSYFRHKQHICLQPFTSSIATQQPTRGHSHATRCIGSVASGSSLSGVSFRPPTSRCVDDPCRATNSLATHSHMAVKCLCTLNSRRHAYSASRRLPIEMCHPCPKTSTDNIDCHSEGVQQSWRCLLQHQRCASAHTSMHRPLSNVDDVVSFRQSRMLAQPQRTVSLWLRYH
jgi:hypothetical protein